MALARWRHVSTLWKRYGRAARTVRQRTAALQRCALRCALGPAVCHVHGLDQFDLRGDKLRPLEWLLVMGLWQLKLNATEIAAAADIQERTAQRCSNLLDGGLYETYHLDPTRQLEPQVDADE